MALNKIFIHKKDLSYSEVKESDSDITFIRKDALLEWASRLKEKWEEPPMSRYSPGCVFMLEQLIEKLNSM